MTPRPHFRYMSLLISGELYLQTKSLTGFSAIAAGSTPDSYTQLCRKKAVLFRAHMGHVGIHPQYTDKHTIYTRIAHFSSPQSNISLLGPLI